MKLTSDQIKAVLAAANVAPAKQDQIAADLLAAQDAPPEDPPMLKNEVRQMLHYMEQSKLDRWPSWATREKQARKQFTGLFAAYDAKQAADVALLREITALAAWSL